MTRSALFIITLLICPALKAQPQGEIKAADDSTSARFKSRSDSLAFVIDSMNVTALDQYKNGFYRQAEKTADQVIKTDPTITWAYMIRGKCRCNLAEKEMMYTRDFGPSVELFEDCISDLKVYIADRSISRDKDYKDAMDRKQEAQEKLKFIRKQKRVPR